MKTAEDWLKDNCEMEDWAMLEDDDINDYIKASNVIRYVKKFAKAQKQDIKKLIESIKDNFDKELEKDEIYACEIILTKLRDKL